MNGFVLFHDDGKEVQAHFQGKSADSLFYFTFDRKISEPCLSSVRSLNSRGTPWVLEAQSTSGRRVYHTTDRKFYAFVSNGNQLMVDKEPFFRKSLHQPGKTILVDDLPECLFAHDHGEALIGSTEATVIKEYGQPIAIAAVEAENLNPMHEETSQGNGTLT
jgi:hypothetical protein